MEKLFHYYFSNVNSLILSYSIIDKKDVESIKIKVNLFNLNFLGFEGICEIKSASILLNILKETPNLSSISIPKRILFSFFNNYQLCQYLNKLIKKLTMSEVCKDTNVYDMIYSSELPQFCQIFFNLKQFQCSMEKWDDLIFILSHLPKLAHLSITTSAMRPENIDIFLQQIQLKLNKNFLYDYFKGKPISKLYIWTGENIN